VTKWLRYIIGFYAYLSLLTDRLPTGDAPGDAAVRFEVRTAGSPSVGNAVWRIILALPSAIVLTLLWIIGVILIVIAAVSVLASESYPSGIYDFLRGLNRWGARLLVYLASLVEAYPPFTLDKDSLGEAPASG